MATCVTPKHVYINVNLNVKLVYKVQNLKVKKKTNLPARYVVFNIQILWPTFINCRPACQSRRWSGEPPLLSTSDALFTPNRSLLTCCQFTLSVVSPGVFWNVSLTSNSSWQYHFQKSNSNPQFQHLACCHCAIFRCWFQITTVCSYLHFTQLSSCWKWVCIFNCYFDALLVKTHVRLVITPRFFPRSDDAVFPDRSKWLMTEKWRLRRETYTTRLRECCLSNREIPMTREKLFQFRLWRDEVIRCHFSPTKASWAQVIP